MPGKDGVNQQANGQKKGIEVPTHDPATGKKYPKKNRKALRKKMTETEANATENG